MDPYPAVTSFVTQNELSKRAETVWDGKDWMRDKIDRCRVDGRVKLLNSKTDTMKVTF